MSLTVTSETEGGAVVSGLPVVLCRIVQPVGIIEVKVEGDHLANLAKSPERGLSELLWNALDADASSIGVTFERNAWDGVTGLLIEDDGEGITREQAELYFGRLGGSWKSTATATQKGRTLHGSQGQGRFAAFALGDWVCWTSVAVGVNGLQLVRISGRARSGKFDLVVEEVPDGTPTGTSVRIEELSAAGARLLNSGTARGRLPTEFALFLEKYPNVSITLDGAALNPEDAQVTKRDVPLSGAPEGASLRVIEWRKPVDRALFLSANGLSPLAEIQPGIQARGFHFTAYLQWAGFAEHADTVMLGELSGEPVNGLIEVARTGLRDYFRARRDERSKQLIETWKADSTYPFREEPTSPVEVAERELFDFVAVTAATAIEDARPQERKLALRLLLQAVQTGPDALNNILEEVLQLEPQQINDLNDLLRRSSLAHVISAAHMITDRLDFLDGLEDIVNDPDLRDSVRERDQLHRILESETWIFGEEYALTVSDRTLTRALRDHKAILGDAELLDDQTSPPVLDADGRHVRVDLLLSRSLPTADGRRRHLVVEIKRPNVSIGTDQINQITNYADTVAEDSRFDQVDTEWSFWIVGDRLDDRARSRAHQRGRAPGVVHEPEDSNVVARAVTWASIIHNARERLSYLKAALNVSSEETSGREYLRRRYAESVDHAFGEELAADEGK